MTAEEAFCIDDGAVLCRIAEALRLKPILYGTADTSGYDDAAIQQSGHRSPALQ
jgi:hypothetical protein